MRKIKVAKSKKLHIPILDEIQINQDWLDLKFLFSTDGNPIIDYMRDRDNVAYPVEIETLELPDYVFQFIAAEPAENGWSQASSAGKQKFARKVVAKPMPKNSEFPALSPGEGESKTYAWGATTHAKIPTSVSDLKILLGSFALTKELTDLKLKIAITQSCVEGITNLLSRLPDEEHTQAAGLLCSVQEELANETITGFCTTVAFNQFKEAQSKKSD